MTEDEVRRLLDARTATIDPPPAPLPEITRLGQSRRRHQRILRAAGAAALVAAVVLGGVGLRLVLEGASSAAPSSQQTSALGGQPPTADQLYGYWRAVTLFGHHVGQPSGPIQKSLIVEFFHARPGSITVDAAKGFTGLGWSGSDLCNTTSGIVLLGEDGTFRLGQADRTQIGCPALQGRLRFEAVRAVLHARWARISNGDLVLYSAKAGKIARFTRIGPAPVSKAKSGAESSHRSPPSTTLAPSAPPTK